MVDFGIIALFGFQILVVGASVVVFLRVYWYLDRLRDLEGVAREAVGRAQEAMEVAKSVKTKNYDEVRDEVQAVRRIAEKASGRIESTNARVSRLHALIRDANEPEGEVQENESFPGIVPMVSNPSPPETPEKPATNGLPTHFGKKAR